MGISENKKIKMLSKLLFRFPESVEKKPTDCITDYCTSSLISSFGMQLLLDAEKLLNIKGKKEALKKNNNNGTELQGGYVQKPYGGADHDRYEDDGTDRKKGRKKGGKEGRTKKRNQQQNLSDCA